MNSRLLIAGIVALALPLGATQLRGAESQTVEVKMAVATTSQAKEEDDEKDEAKEKKSENTVVKKNEAKEEDDEKDEKNEKKSAGKEEEDETPHAKKEKLAPKAVQDAVKQLIGKGKLLSLAPEDGNYELDYKVNGIHQAAIISADGKILEEEVTVEASTLPKPVIAAVKKLYPKGKITLAEKSTTKDGSVYELTVSIEKSITVSPTGKVQ